MTLAVRSHRSYTISELSRQLQTQARPNSADRELLKERAITSLNENDLLNCFRSRSNFCNLLKAAAILTSIPLVPEGPGFASEDRGMQCKAQNVDGSLTPSRLCNAAMHPQDRSQDSIFRYEGYNSKKSDWNPNAALHNLAISLLHIPQIAHQLCDQLKDIFHSAKLYPSDLAASAPTADQAEQQNNQLIAARSRLMQFIVFILKRQKSIDPNIFEKIINRASTEVQPEVRAAILSHSIFILEKLLPNEQYKYPKQFAELIKSLPADGSRQCVSQVFMSNIRRPSNEEQPRATGTELALGKYFDEIQGYANEAVVIEKSPLIYGLIETNRPTQSQPNQKTGNQDLELGTPSLPDKKTNLETLVNSFKSLDEFNSVCRKTQGYLLSRGDQPNVLPGLASSLIKNPDQDIPLSCARLSKILPLAERPSSYSSTSTSISSNSNDAQPRNDDLVTAYSRCIAFFLLILHNQKSIDLDTFYAIIQTASEKVCSEELEHVVTLLINILRKLPSNEQYDGNKLYDDIKKLTPLINKLPTDKLPTNDSTNKITKSVKESVIDFFTRHNISPAGQSLCSNPSDELLTAILISSTLHHQGSTNLKLFEEIIERERTQDIERESNHKKVQPEARSYILFNLIDTLKQLSDDDQEPYIEKFAQLISPLPADGRRQIVSKHFTSVISRPLDQEIFLETGDTFFSAKFYDEIQGYADEAVREKTL